MHGGAQSSMPVGRHVGSPAGADAGVPSVRRCRQTDTAAGARLAPRASRRRGGRGVRRSRGSWSARVAVGWVGRHRCRAWRVRAVAPLMAAARHLGRGHTHRPHRHRAGSIARRRAGWRPDVELRRTHRAPGAGRRRVPARTPCVAAADPTTRTTAGGSAGRWYTQATVGPGAGRVRGGADAHATQEETHAATQPLG
jgi:hypothetical protein